MQQSFLYLSKHKNIYIKKEIMNKIPLVFIMAITTMMFSQEDPTFYVSASQDVKMAFNGAHGDGGQLNPEFTIGFNINEDWRVWTGYEYFKQIDYQKYTFLAIDHVIDWNDVFEPVRILEQIKFKIGIEGSIIYRDKINPNDIYFGYNHDNLSFGINGEIGYNLNKSIQLFINGNVFKSEPHDNFGYKMKKIRTDVRFGVNINIFKIP